VHFSREEIQKAAQDARISVSAQQEEELLAELKAFPLQEDFFLRLQKENVEQTCYGPVEENIMASDEPGASLPLSEVLQNAPDADESCFLVPKVVE